ncbi:GNAT family N-acetyltransferase [Leeia aquatica]|uniref:GNAT family N-acetyltransferase n=1 Tax=Leeia aquatica TaxID=2725557 RepID=A0A847SDM4_9NEIS|nr:GNAT family N-acetyltransferase [Leeia aquatica]NLR75409.1 GNAT family N-acetyltransferase [Leeia aquatica]
MLFETDWSVGQVEPKDIPYVYQLIQAAFQPYVGILPSRPSALDMSEASLLSSLQGHGGTMLVRSGQDVIATGAWVMSHGQAWLKRIAVHPSQQGTGVGRYLVMALERHAIEAGVSHMKLGTRRRLPGNLIFYTRLGYSECGREPYPPGVDDEVVWMCKTLQP